jgi:uncharacterized protein YcbX
MSTNGHEQRYRVARLSVTPVKGFALHHPDSVELDASGARGDRDLFMVDDTGRLLSITRTGAFSGITARYEDGGATLALLRGDELLLRAALPAGEPVTARFHADHRVPGRVVGGAWTDVLSDLAGESVRLVRSDAPGAGSDVRPVTLLGSASVAELSRRLGRPVDARRFRMLVELATDAPHAEEGWDGMALVGEDVVVRVHGPTPRCAAITRHPDRGDRDDPLVKEIKAYRGVGDTELGPGVCFGAYGEVARPGTLRVGDELALRRP